MESPPQYPGAPKKSNTGKIIGIIALAVVLCCCGCGGAAYYFFKGAMKGGGGMIGCTLSIQNYRDAALDYAEKNGGKLPPAKTWQDDLKPFLKRDKSLDQPGMPFTIPTAESDFCDQEGNTTIAYNTALVGKKLDAVKDKSTTVMFFEVPGKGRNRTAAWTEQPYASSPVILMGQRRGWIRVPVEGEPEFKNQQGRVAPVPTRGQVNFGN